MKTILVTVSDATVSKNFLRGPFLKTLREAGGNKIVLLCRSSKIEEYKNEFGSTQIVFESFDISKTNFFDKFSAYIARNGLASGTVQMNQMREYVDNGGLLNLIIKRIIWYVGKLFPRLTQNLLRYFELHIPAHSRTKEIFDLYAPDLVFATSVTNANFDVQMLREARVRGITSLAIPRGWDNFSAHGIIRVLPDTLLLQNAYLKDTSIRFQNMKCKMKVIGFAQNDPYVDKGLIEERACFLEKLGVPSGSKYVLFCALGDYLVPSEWQVAEVFEDLINEKRIPHDLLMIYRAHPSFPSSPEKIKSFPHVVHSRKAHYSDSSVRTWEMDKDDIAFYINSIVHSEMVITTGSTGALDALALGKPAVSFVYEKYPLKYWLSVRRFRRHFTHYEELLATGGVYRADTPEELAIAINRYLEDPVSTEQELLREQFTKPQDGHAGERAAREILASLAA